jgi:hypothetical protein
MIVVALQEEVVYVQENRKAPISATFSLTFFALVCAQSQK